VRARESESEGEDLFNDRKYEEEKKKSKLRWLLD
jgi:hypothetical protein